MLNIYKSRSKIKVYFGVAIWATLLIFSCSKENPAQSPAANNELQGEIVAPQTAQAVVPPELASQELKITNQPTTAAFISNLKIVVHANRVALAKVKLYNLTADSTGELTAMPGELVAEGKTDEQGIAYFQLNRSVTSTIYVASSEGTYIDEATGVPTKIPSTQPLTAFVEVAAEEAVAPVTPVTTAVAQKVKTLYSAKHSLKDAMKLAKEQIAKIFEISQAIIDVIPENSAVHQGLPNLADLDALSPPSQQKQASILMAAISVLGEKYNTLLEMVDAGETNANFAENLKNANLLAAEIIKNIEAEAMETALKDTESCDLPSAEGHGVSVDQETNKAMIQNPAAEYWLLKPKTGAPNATCNFDYSGKTQPIFAGNVIETFLGKVPDGKCFPSEGVICHMPCIDCADSKTVMEPSLTKFSYCKAGCQGMPRDLYLGSIEIPEKSLYEDDDNMQDEKVADFKCLKNWLNSTHSLYKNSQAGGEWNSAYGACGSISKIRWVVECGGAEGGLRAYVYWKINDSGSVNYKTIAGWRGFLPTEGVGQLIAEPWPANAWPIDLNIGVKKAVIEKTKSKMTVTATPLETPTETAMAMPLETPTETAMAMPLETPTETAMAMPLETPTETAMAMPLETPTETAMAMPLETPTETAMAMPLETPTETALAMPSESPYE